MLVSFSAGCRFSGLAFRQDDRLQVLSPPPRATVELPVELEWTFTPEEGDDDGGDAVAAFAVFVDVSPMPPGETFDYFARDDPQCLRDPRCPDVAYLRGLGVYRANDTSLTLKNLRDTRPEEQPDAKERHEVSIALLDEENRRIGESALYVDFFLDRRTRS